MNTTTLRGVFPEPNFSEPAYKRNFIKENVKHIKHMQGLLQNSGVGEDRFRNKPNKTLSQFNSLTKSGHAMQNSQSNSRCLQSSKSLKVPKQKIDVERGKGDARNCQHGSVTVKCLEKHTNRGVQTERVEDMKKLYETGIIKYPSPALVKAIAIRSSAKKKEGGKLSQDRGDGGNMTNPNSKGLSENMQNLDLGEEQHDYIKENIMAIKQRPGKLDSVHETGLRVHPRGSLPKYLKDRKEKAEIVVDADCPDGHVLLPEEERKETLKVLRQSYADRIQELNSMPVRNDTLRMRNRKIAIEEELKKIDEGIKVFQRPKVFVKINA